jgi:predicted ATP-grasp superfamily ATP-dependent carboligase
LCGRAGVDFPFLAWQFVHGVVTAERRGRAGVHWVRITTDMLAAAEAIRHGGLSLRQYLASFHRPLEFAIWAKDDLSPALLEVPSLLHAKMKLRYAANHSNHSLHAELAGTRSRRLLFRMVLRRLEHERCKRIQSR